MSNTTPTRLRKLLTPRKFFALLLLTVAVMPLTGFDSCNGSGKDDLVLIGYRPLATFRVYDAGNGHGKAVGSEEIFAAYRITSIHNSGKDAVDFNFKPSRIFTKGSNGVNNTPSNSLSTSPLALNLDGYLIDLNFSQKIVPSPDALKFNNGPGIRIIILDDMGANESKTAYSQLFYDKEEGGQNVMMFPEPDDALPVYLEPGTPQGLAENK